MIVCVFLSFFDLYEIYIKSSLHYNMIHVLMLTLLRHSLKVFLPSWREICENHQRNGVPVIRHRIKISHGHSSIRRPYHCFRSVSKVRTCTNTNKDDRIWQESSVLLEVVIWTEWHHCMAL